MVSSVKTADIIEFLGIDDPGETITREVETLKASAVSFIYNYTGLTAEEADTFPELDFALMVLVQDMYDNRARYVERATLNQTVESILNLHARALL